jgi:ABC-type amino acid transport substrate-binding protein
MLLALNLRLDGQQLFRAAGIADEFPYEPGLQIARPPEDDESPFSFRFNMDSFSSSIRSIVRSEMKQRNVRDLLGSRPLRIGMNYLMYWVFDSEHPPANERHTGLFPEFCEMLGMTLQKQVELVYVPFSNYLEQLRSGHIDLFGPTMVVPNLPVQVNFSTPIFRLGISAIVRKRPDPSLPDLPIPTKPEQLSDVRFQITVNRNSLPHLITNTLLKRSDSTIIVGSSDDECVERVLMRGLQRPAHIFVTNSVRAIHEAKKHPKELAVIFHTRSTVLDFADVGMPVRPDWPEVVPVINDAIRFLQARGGLTERIMNLYKGELSEVAAM